MFGQIEFEVLAGDFSKAKGICDGRDLKIKRHDGSGELFHVSDVTHCEVATEESYKKLSGRLGWGAAGALVFGPLGALAGVALGGSRRDITFIMMFDDQRKLLAKTDEKTFGKLQAALFK